MKKSILKVLALCLVTSTLFTNCKKEAGPKGDKGDKGDAGVSGTNGTNGTNGSANVQAFNLNVTSWTWDNANKWRWATFTIPQLNQSVLNTGMIALYQVFSNGSQIQLPATINITGSVQEHDFYSPALNKLDIYIEFSDLSDPNPAPANYKLVIIPSARIMPNVNHKNYEEVKAAYKLAD